MKETLKEFIDRTICKISNNPHLTVETFDLASILKFLEPSWVVSHCKDIHVNEQI